MGDNKMNINDIESRFKVMGTRINELTEFLGSLCTPSNLEDIANFSNVFNTALDVVSKVLLEKNFKNCQEHKISKILYESNLTKIPTKLSYSKNLFCNAQFPNIRYQAINEVFKLCQEILLQSRESEGSAKFSVGNKVKIINASFGLGDVAIGDYGIITMLDTIQQCAVLDTDKQKNWVCMLSDICLPKQEAEEAAVYSDDIMNACNNFIGFKNSITQNLNDIINSKARYINETKLALESRIYNANIDINKIKESIKIIEDRAMPTNAKDIYPAMQNLLNNKYERFYTDANLICGLTHEIYITYNFEDENIPKNVKLGQYYVLINIEQNSIKVTPNSSDSCIGDHFHPHVNTEGIPCLGSYAEPIKRAFKNSNYIEVFMLMYDFLNSVYDKGWYLHLAYWATQDEICDQCFYLEENCNCDNDEDKCSTCGCHSADCKCYHCLKHEENITLFPDRSCVSCADLVKNKKLGKWLCKFNILDEESEDARITTLIRPTEPNPLIGFNINYTTIE